MFLFFPQKCTSTQNLSQKKKYAPLRCIPRLTTHGQSEACGHLAACLMENKGTGWRSSIPSLKKNTPYSWNCSHFSVALQAHGSSSNFGKKGIWGINLGIYFHNKVRRMLKKKKEPASATKLWPILECFALPYVTVAHQSAPGCLQGLVPNPSEAFSSCSKWTDLAEDCLPWPQHSSPVSRIQIIDFSDATFEERAREEKRKGWEEEEGRKNKIKKSLSEQSRRLPTWLECNSMSDLHTSSVRHALGCHLFHLSLTWKCVCIPNGWRRGWATAPSDSEGSIRQVWLFFISSVCLSEGLQLLWFDESPSSLHCAGSVALLPSCG